MRRLIFIAVLAATVVMWKFSSYGIFLTAAAAAAAIAAVIENFTDKPYNKVTYEKLFLQKGGSPVLTFEGRKRLKGEVVCENFVTGEISRTKADIRKDRTLTLPEQKKCGGLLIRYFSFYRYDLLGLTRRLTVCAADNPVTVLPDGPSAELDDIIAENTGGAELDGAREARPDDRLRRVNLKLTHRFGKPYINTYSPEDKGELWLFADCGFGDRADIIAEMITGIAQLLTARGIRYGLAVPDNEGGVTLMADTDCETVQAEILFMPLYNPKAGGVLLRLLDELDDDTQILAFTPNTTANDERLTLIS